MKLIRNKYHCPKCGHDTLSSNAKRCPMCGNEVIKVIDGKEAVQRAVKQVGIFTEGVLTLALIMTIAQMGEHFWGAWAGIAAILTAMVVAVPMLAGFIPKKRKRCRR